MTQINFYHLTATPLDQALPKLLEKAGEAGFRTLVKVADEATMATLDKALWTYDAGSFMAHGCDTDDHAADQPVYLTMSGENANNAKLLAITDGSTLALEGYDRVLDLFDGNNENVVQAARIRWKAYKEAEHELQYWQQTEQGGWAKKG